MRILLQRVSRAAVRVDGQIVGAIDKGFVALVGVTHGDSQTEVDWLAHKVAGLRVFEDDEGKMNLSLLDVGGRVLVISQFTLYGDASRGRRPSFTNAAPPDLAQPLVEQFAAGLRRQGLQVASGVFGAHMEVEIHNDGPVTMMLEKTAS